jgi:hypothetical protein
MSLQGHVAFLIEWKGVQSILSFGITSGLINISIRNKSLLIKSGLQGNGGLLSSYSFKLRRNLIG